MNIGRDIAETLVAKILAGSYSHAGTLDVARKRLPVLKKEGYVTDEIKCYVHFAAKEGDEQDRSSEDLIYQIAVSVASHTPDLASEDAVELFVEEVQDEISSVANRTFTLATNTSDEVTLILPFVNDPIFNPRVLREDNIFLSVTVFNYQYYKLRS